MQDHVPVADPNSKSMEKAIQAKTVEGATKFHYEMIICTTLEYTGKWHVTASVFKIYEEIVGLQANLKKEIALQMRL